MIIELIIGVITNHIIQIIFPVIFMYLFRELPPGNDNGDPDG